MPKLAQVAPSSDTEALRSFKREGKGIFDGDARFGTESQLPRIQLILLFIPLEVSSNYEWITRFEGETFHLPS